MDGGAWWAAVHGVATLEVFLRLWQETLISLDFCRWPQGASQNAYEKSGILWRWEGPLLSLQHTMAYSLIYEIFRRC